jgi:hypothetical protein
MKSKCAQLQLEKAKHMRDAGIAFKEIAKQLGVSTAKARQMVSIQDRREYRAAEGLDGRTAICLKSHLSDEFRSDNRWGSGNLKSFAAEIAKMSRKDLLSIPGIGKKMVNEIEAWLDAQGYKLEPDSDEIRKAIQMLSEHGYVVRRR